jgi:hypothetical protein
MQKGITYIVRPRIEPANKPNNLERMVFGFSQLLVGPASAFALEQIKVRSSTLATSLASERTKKLLGRFCGLRRINFFRACTPIDALGLAEGGDFFDPVFECLIHNTSE